MTHNTVFMVYAYDKNLANRARKFALYVGLLECDDLYQVDQAFCTCAAPSLATPFNLKFRPPLD